MGNAPGVVGGVIGGIPGMVVGTVVGKAVEYIITEDCWNCGTDNGRHRTYCRRCGKRL